MKLSDYHTFAAVAASESISGAATRLGIPKSTVSRRIRRLEDALGVELLRRSARSVSLTQLGDALYRRIRSALTELEDAKEALVGAGEEPSGVLRLTTTPSFGQSREVIECIAAYGVRHPKVTVDLSLTKRVVHLVEEGFDVGLRLHPVGVVPGSSLLMSRHLLTFNWAIYASPTYLAEAPPIRSPEDLTAHRLALHSLVGVQDDTWCYNGVPLSRPLSFPAPRWKVDDSSALERLALSGAGLVILETMTAEPWVAQGALKRVLAGYTGEAGAASLVWPASRHLAPRVRAFIDHAVKHLAS